MITLGLAFGASFIFIALKAAQQRNVMGLHYLWVLPFSMGMALVEVFVIDVVATQGYSLLLALVIGLGSGLGAILSMYLHQKHISNGSREQTRGK